MRKAESTLSTPWGPLLALIRGVLVFFGTTFGAHALVTGTTAGRLRPLGDQDFAATVISGAEVPGYGTWLGQASRVDSDLVGAVFNSAWMTVVAVVIGSALGWLFAILARFRPVGKPLGLLVSPITAIAMPGVLLLPIYRWADARQYLPEGPTGSDVSATGSVGFVVFWGTIVGLALAPAIGAQLAGEQRYRTAGFDIATLGSAVRTANVSGRRVGLPITALLLSLTAVELIADSNGAFSYFYDQLSAGDLAGALDVVFVVAVSGAILTSLIGFRAVFGQTEPGNTTATPATRHSDTVWPLLAAITVISVMAIVGYLRDPLLAADQNQLLNSPSIGGPWLGTDGLGRSMVERLVITLGPTLFAGLFPGAMAAAIGAGLTTAVQRAPRTIGHVFDGLIELLWWPLPLLLPLVHLYAGNPERSEFDLVVIAVTGLMLVPLAVRIFGRAEPLVGMGVRTVMTTWFFLAGLGSSARILLGFMGVTNSTNGPEHADLGALISSTDALAPLSTISSVVITAITGIVLLSLLYWLAAAMSAPVPFKALVPAAGPTVAGSTAEQPVAERQAALQPAEPPRRDGPLQPQDLRTIVRPAYDSDLESEPPGDLEGGTPDNTAAIPPADQATQSEQDEGEITEIDLRSEADTEAPVKRRPVVNLVDQKAKDAAAGAPASEAAEETWAAASAEPGDIADRTASKDTDAQQTTAERSSSKSTGDDLAAGDDLAPEHDGDDDDEVDEETQAELDMLNATSIDLAAQASQTIELRPSTLRRAGIIAPGASPPPARGNEERPILAERAEDYEQGSPTGQQVEQQAEDQAEEQHDKQQTDEQRDD